MKIMRKLNFAVLSLVIFCFMGESSLQGRDPNEILDGVKAAFNIIEDYEGALSDFNLVIRNIDLPSAYYNKGLLSILLNNKENGCYALSKAGELGVTESYYIIKQYCGN